MKITKLEQILKDLEKEEIGSTSKLYLVYHLTSFDNYNELKEEARQKIVDYCYRYWIHLDSLEHTEYDYIEAIANSIQYIGYDIFGNIEKLSYNDFVNIIEEKEVL